MTDARYHYHHQLYSPGDVAYARFLGALVDEDLAHGQEASWPSDATSLRSALPSVPSWSGTDGSRETAFISTGGQAAFIRLGAGEAHAAVAAITPEGAAELLNAIRKWLPASEGDDDTVPVRFWALSSNGPFSVRRRLDAPVWEEIAGNYPAAVRAVLGDITEGFRPAHGGQLLLWHGEPGTGKTWAIRALGRAWASWCDVEYIVDPEKFFGTEAAYLMQVLLEQASEAAPAGPDEKAPARWRLLVMEDTGELLTVDAGERAGKGLSRFLNVVDGFIGQGLRVLVLLTTNERIEELHPAVARPGRTALELPFDKLSAKESAYWAREHGIRTPEERPHTLAELYGIAGEFAQRPPHRPAAGFRVMAGGGRHG